MCHGGLWFYYFQKGLLTAYNKINVMQMQLLKTIDKEKN